SHAPKLAEGLRTPSKPSVLTTESAAASCISHMSITVAFNVSMPVGNAAMFAPEISNGTDEYDTATKRTAIQQLINATMADDSCI
ncbi:hypothetical protein Tco_1289541, partial [Tanacetum coccineum]